MMCTVVLAFEVVVIALAVPVAVNLAGFSPAVAGGVWGGLAFAALVLAAVQRFRWGYYAGWALQVAFVASGFLVPGLAILGVIFIGLWIVGIIVGTKTDAMKAAADRAADRRAADSAEPAAG